MKEDVNEKVRIAINAILILNTCQYIKITYADEHIVKDGSDSDSFNVSLLGLLEISKSDSFKIESLLMKYSDMKYSDIQNSLMSSPFSELEIAIIDKVFNGSTDILPLEDFMSEDEEAFLTNYTSSPAYILSPRRVSRDLLAGIIIYEGDIIKYLFREYIGERTIIE